MKKHASSLLLISTLCATPVLSETASRTTVGLGMDYTSGHYGSTQLTESLTLPISIKHENGPWSLKASLPWVSTTGTFSRDAGVTECHKSGTVCTTTTTTTQQSTTESGMGDLTLSAFRNLVDTPDGFLFDAGLKAKLATADKTKTLISSGENDYSIQGDFAQSIGKSGSLISSVGWTKKGDTATSNFLNPLYGTFGASVSFDAGTLGATWDFRQKTTKKGQPVSEVSLFYSARLSVSRRLQIYVLKGLAEGSPDQGGGLAWSNRF